MRRIGIERSAICSRDIGVAPTGSGKVAVFVIFATGSKIPGYVFHHLEALKRTGFDVVVISNNRKIGDRSMDRLCRTASVVLRRYNMGYDFGAYRDGILYALNEFPDAREILLVNDSVFGPLTDLSTLFERARNLSGDVVGLIDSAEIRYHFQSFWLLFREGALRLPAFRRFWERMPYLKDKSAVVQAFETGLVTRFEEMGLECEPIFSSLELVRRSIPFLEAKQRDLLQDLTSDGTSLEEMLGFQSYSRLLFKQHNENLLRMCATGRPLNPTVFLWEPLIVELGFPFLKREIVVRNPANDPILSRIEKTVAATGYPLHLIDNFLSGGR